jgi:two-component system, sensor histidine kinase and response regulator
VDDRLPDLNAAVFAAAIRSEAEGTIPRLVLMARPPSGSESVSARERGYSAVLTRPIRRLHLWQVLSDTFQSARPAVRPESSREPTQPFAPLSPEGARILLAEDNRVNQKVALRQLERNACRADAVASGAEALEALARIHYDLVLMDCQMPEMDGYEATEEIRRREQGTGKHIPIIALTAHAMPGDRERCLGVGMDDYLAKPFKEHELMEKVLRWLPPAAPARSRLAA